MQVISSIDRVDHERAYHRRKYAPCTETSSICRLENDAFHQRGKTGRATETRGQTDGLLYVRAVHNIHQIHSDPEVDRTVHV